LVLLVCHVHIPKLPSSHHQGNIANNTSPCGHHEWAWSCPQFYKILGCLMPNCFLVCTNIFPLPLFPSFFFIFLFFYHMAFWSLTRAISKFKIPSKISLKHIESKLKGFEFKFHVSLVSTFMNVVESNPFLWNRSPSMKIHEILEWYKVPRNIIYILFRPWNVVHSRLFFCGINSSKFYIWTSMQSHLWIFNGWFSFTNMHKCSWLKN